MSQRGDGSIYQRHRRSCDRRKPCACPWWAKYYVAGRPIREPTGCRTKADAQNWLRARIVRVGRYGYEAFVLRVRDLETVLQTDYLVNGRRSGTLRNVPRIWRHLNSWFGDKRVANLRYGDLNSYVSVRLESGAKPGTVKHELALLHRAMNLVEGLILPRFPSLHVDNARQRFFTREQFERLRAELPDYLHGIVTFMYLTGWRTSEVLSLEWRDIDWQNEIINLRAENSKNRRPRQIPFNLIPALRDILIDAREQVHTERVRYGRTIPWVFTRNGRQVRSFREAWRRARERAHLTHTPHDLRRTAVRNMELVLKIPRTVAMKIVGHRTEAMYTRYAISNSEDVAAAMARIDSHYRTETKTAKVIPFARKS